MKFATPDKFLCRCSLRTGARIVAFLAVIATWFEFCFFFPDWDCRKLETGENILKALETCKNGTNLFKMVLEHLLLILTFMKRTQDKILIWVRCNLYILLFEGCLLFISIFFPGTSTLIIRLLLSIGFHSFFILVIYSYCKQQNEHVPKLTVFDKNSSNNLDHDLNKDIDLEKNTSYDFYFEAEEEIIDSEKYINNNCILNPNEEIIIDFKQQISCNFDFDSKQEIIGSKKHPSNNSPDKEVTNSEKHTSQNFANDPKQQITSLNNRTLLYPLVLHPMLSLGLHHDLPQPESVM